LLIPARYKSSMLITGNNISIIPKSRPMNRHGSICCTQGWC
jgi:hypothetical protein